MKRLLNKLRKSSSEEPPSYDSVIAQDRLLEQQNVQLEDVQENKRIELPVYPLSIPDNLQHELDLLISMMSTAIEENSRRGMRAFYIFMFIDNYPDLVGFHESSAHIYLDRKKFTREFKSWLYEGHPYVCKPFKENTGLELRTSKTPCGRKTFVMFYTNMFHLPCHVTTL